VSWFLYTKTIQVFHRTFSQAVVNLQEGHWKFRKICHTNCTLC